jgi:acyl-CoA thioesterase FadM
MLWMKGVRQGFRQEMTRTSDDALVATADLTLALLHAHSHKPARVPAWIKKVLENG